MVETQENKIIYTISAGSTSSFVFNLPFFEPENIHCYWLESAEAAEVELVRGTDFSVQVLADYSQGANITLLRALTVGAKLAIVRELPITQGLDLPNYGKIPSSDLELQLDRVVMMVQQNAESITRAALVPFNKYDSTTTPWQQFTSLANAASGYMSGALVASSGAVVAMSGAQTAFAGAMVAMSGAQTACSGAVVAMSGAQTASSGAMVAMSGAQTASSGAMVAMSGAQTASSGASTCPGSPAVRSPAGC